MGRKRAGTGRPRKVLLVLAAAVVVATVASAVPGAAFGRSSAKTISVAIVKNPQMTDIASLTPSLFTAKSGIKVKYTILDEGKLREITTRDVARGKPVVIGKRQLAGNVPSLFAQRCKEALRTRDAGNGHDARSRHRWPRR